MGAGLIAADLVALVPRLRRYARALTRHREAADDLLQDTLERAWDKRALWEAGSDLRAWLFTVMHNVFVSSVRQTRPSAFSDDDLARIESEATSVETGAVVGELHAALLRLPEEQRAVVLLVGLEQMSYAETAEMLEIPIGTVMSRLSRGRERLRGLLDRDDAHSSAGLRRIK